MNGEPVHIIAEAGCNHNGDRALALQLVQVAAEARANSIKFQIIDPDQLYLPGRYEFGSYDIDKVREMRRQHMLTDGDYNAIKSECDRLAIPLSASIFDEQGLELLCSLTPPYIKIASTDLNNLRLLRKVAGRGFRLILSTGMSSLGDIERSVNELTKCGQVDLVLMHCVSVYPAPLRLMNLRMLEVLRSAFGFPVGLSDHTRSSIAACMALHFGVTYIEKHFTLDQTLDGFDHAHAASGDELVNYIQDIRDAEVALTTNSTRLSDEERYTRKRARRALYAAHDLNAGQTVEYEDVLVVRPEGPMGADEVDVVVGATMVRDLAKHQPFRREYLT
ncbi:MAG: N-acetylneuraminate synthase family protein [Pirellulaceae bacterium]|nr:N-acetylneuraminate synthase family protein [Pirellulaceae bacterium]